MLASNYDTQSLTNTQLHMLYDATNQMIGIWMLKDHIHTSVTSSSLSCAISIKFNYLCLEGSSCNSIIL